MGTPATRMLVDETGYLAAERETDVRHEFVDGALYAMAAPSPAHDLLTTNLTTALAWHLEGSGCRLASSDMKVRLGGGRRYYYPDIVVSCGDIQDEPDAFTMVSPVLIVEIISPSTAAIDRHEKRLAYQALPSLVNYLIVWQDRAFVERLTRNGTGWTQSGFGPDGTIELASVGMTLAIAELYAGVLQSTRIVRPAASDSSRR